MTSRDSAARASNLNVFAALLIREILPSRIFEILAGSKRILHSSVQPGQEGRAFFKLFFRSREELLPVHR